MLGKDTPQPGGEESKPKEHGTQPQKVEKKLPHENFRPLFYFVHRLDSLFFVSPDLQERLDKEMYDESVTSVLSASAEQQRRSAEKTPYYQEGKGLVVSLLELANTRASRERLASFRKRLEQFLVAGHERKPVMVLKSGRPVWGALKTPLPAEVILQEFDACLEEVFRK